MIKLLSGVQEYVLCSDLRLPEVLREGGGGEARLFPVAVGWSGAQRLLS